MNRFFKNTCLFILLSVITIEGLSAILMYTNLYMIGYPGKEIYHSILKSKKKSKAKILIIGDSVANQLFSNKKYNDDINSLACNKAITMVGQYILLKNYLEAGNKIDTLVGIFTPFSFQDNLDDSYTYHYFAKPFYTKEYKVNFSNNVVEQLDKIPFISFRRLPHILATSWAPKLNATQKHHFTFLSPISIEYLHKIKDLACLYNFEIILSPPPISIERKIIIEKIDKHEFSEFEFSKEFENYFHKIKYLDDTIFNDGAHFLHPDNLSEEEKNKLLR